MDYGWKIYDYLYLHREGFKGIMDAMDKLEYSPFYSGSSQFCADEWNQFLVSNIVSYYFQYFNVRKLGIYMNLCSSLGF